MQVIEMDDMILDQLSASYQVADKTRVVWNGNTKCILHRAYRSQRMNRRADTTDALGKYPGIARIAVAQNHLDATKHRARTPGVRHTAILDFDFNPQMPFNAGDGINGNSHGWAPSSSVLVCALAEPAVTGTASDAVADSAWLVPVTGGVAVFEAAA